MRRFLSWTGILFQTMLFMVSMLAVAGQSASLPAGYNRSTQLPAKYQELVPQGYTLDNPQWVRYGTMANLSFVARKQFSGRHSLSFSEYHLDLNIKEAPGLLIERQAPMYKKQLEAEVEEKINSRRQDNSDPTVAYDPPKLTKYPWGTGITQRVLHKYMGAGTKPDEIEYACVYLGLITDDHSIKKFTLSVSGVATLDAADAWAKQAAEKIAKTSLSNLGD